MFQCICATELDTALHIPDLVKIVQSYMSRKSDMDIIADKLLSGPDALYVSFNADRDGHDRERCEIDEVDVDAEYSMSIELMYEHAISGREILVIYGYIIGAFGNSDGVRIFDAEHTYVPDALMKPEKCTFAGWCNRRIFKNISSRARQEAHEKITHTLATYGCRHH